MRTGRRQLAAALAAVVATGAALASSPADAGGFSISILGARRTGMMTNLAAPDDLTALFHNPAGLADQPGWRFHVSGSSTFMDTSFHLQALDPVRFPEINPAGCGTAGQPACPWPTDGNGYYSKNIKPNSYFGVLPYLGASHDLGFLGGRGRDVVVSLAVTAPNLYGADLPADAPTAYNFRKGFFAVASVQAGAGWKVNDWLSVGASLAYNYMLLTYSQRISLADTLRGATPTPDDEALADQAQGLLGDLMLDYEGTDHGVGWNLGILVRPRRWVSFGFSYNGSTSPVFSGPMTLKSINFPTVNLNDVVSGFDIKLPSRLKVTMGIPHSVQLGLNFVPRADRMIEIGLDYRLWLYQLLGRQTIEPVYDPAAAGREPMTTDSLSKNKDYGPSWELAAGVLVRPWRAHRGLELMAGIAFDKSPIPDRWFSLDNPSMNQLCASTGVRWQVTPRWRVAATYFFDYYMPRDVRDSGSSPPMNVRGTAIGHTPRLEVEGTF